MFEGGTRVPCIVSWPSVTTANTRSDAMIQSEDYYPTLLAGLGIEPEPNQRFDGVNLLPAFNGDQLKGRAVFQFFPHSPPVPEWLPPSVSVHQDDWKLIRIFHSGDGGAHRYLLFNLKDDIGERTNLSKQHSEKVKELDLLITHFLDDTKAVVPVRNPSFDLAKFNPELEGKRPPNKKEEPKAKTPAKRKVKQ